MTKPNIPAEVLARNTEASGDCILWTAGLNGKGYGSVKVGGKLYAAHRLAYETEHGPVPRGSDVDHACHNRACVNLDHLRVATRTQNGSNRRGANPNSGTGVRNVYAIRGGYRVLVRSKGKLHAGGWFATIEEATIAASDLRAELFGEFAGRS